MNPIEKSADRAVAAVQSRTPFSVIEHAEVSAQIDELEWDIEALLDRLNGRGYKKTAANLRSAVHVMKKVRAEQNTRFLMEKRDRRESPYYGGKVAPEAGEEGAIIPVVPEGADYGFEGD